MVSVEHEYTFPDYVNDIDTMFMVLLYIRKYNKQEKVIFEQYVDESNPKMLCYHIQSETPMLMNIIHPHPFVKLNECININNLTAGSIITTLVSNETSQKIEMKTTTKFTKQATGGIKAVTYFQMDLGTPSSKHLANLISKPFGIWYKSKSARVRELELKIYNDLS